MKNIASKQYGNPPNYPTDGDVFTKMLEAMTTEELTDGLNEVLESITAENYDPTLIDAYLAALDRKDPMPEVPDVEISFSNFQKRVSRTFPARKDAPAISRHRFQHFARIGLVAALTIVFLISGMVIAQAVGLDVFGVMARWTDEVFSLGTIRSTGADDETTSAIWEDTHPDVVNETEYASLQDALNKYGITEISEPTWIPNEYAFERIEIACWPDDGGFIGLYAT